MRKCVGRRCYTRFTRCHSLLHSQRFLTLQRLKQRSDDSKLVISKGNAGTFIIDPIVSGGRRRGGGGGGGSGGGSLGSRVRTAAFSRASSSASLLAAGLRGSRSGWDLMPGEAQTPIQVTAAAAAATAQAEAVASPTSTLAPVVTPAVAAYTPQWGSKIRVGSGAAVPAVVPRSRRSSSRSGAAARSAFGISTTSASSAGLKRVASGELLVLADASSLSYLDGTLPGDMGFDPLGLFAPGLNAGFLNQQWLRYSEVIHGRWAMLGVTGCLAPEFLAYEQVIPEEHGVVWFKTGFLPTAGQDYEFWLDGVSLTWIMLIGMGFAETRRIQDFMKPGSLATGFHIPLSLDRALSTPPGQDPVYPGGPIFNFLGIVESESATYRFKEKEIRHGRLAMVAALGIFAQALATHDGPFINVLDHMFDPLNNNVLTNLQAINE